MSKGPARLNQDRGNSVLIANGAATVFIDNEPLAVMGTIAANGAAVITSSNSILAENKGMARSSDLMSDGSSISTGSAGACAGD
jgi:predicted GTPase